MDVIPYIFNAPVLVLIGPTAIGKTALSLDMARRFGCEIVSMDSMQVYRYMDIGTAKPTPEERGDIPHHLIDIADPDEPYDAARFVADALEVLQRIHAAGNIPLITGGTGLYLKALTQGLFDPGEEKGSGGTRERLFHRIREEGRAALYAELQEVDPETAARLHPNDTQRLVRGLEIFQETGIPWSVHLQRQGSAPRTFTKLLQIGLNCERQELYQRISARTKQMLDRGLLDEVAKLREMGYSPNLQSMQAIGYRHANRYLDGAWDRDEMTRLLIRDTRRYAKRQLTWFGSIAEIRWYAREAADDILAATDRWLNEGTGSDTL